MFVPTQSQEAAQQSDTKTLSQPIETDSRRLDPAPFTLPLELSLNTESSSTAQQTSQHPEEDSQATQIEDLPEEPPGVDTSDSAMSRCGDKKQSNGVPSEPQSATSSKESPKHCSECAEDEQSQKSDVHAKTLNVENVNVKDSEEATSADVVSCSHPKFDSSDLTVNSCVQETPSDTTPSSLPSQSMICQTSAVDEVRSSVSRGGETARSRSAESSSQKCGTVGGSQTVKDTIECEEVMEEESTLGGGSSGLALVLSQSQLLSPEPMEEDDEDRGEDSAVVIPDSERDSQILQKDVTPQAKTNSSQPIRGTESASTNGHESQVQAKKVHVASERTGPEPEGLKDKSLSDSSGGKLDRLKKRFPT